MPHRVSLSVGTSVSQHTTRLESQFLFLWFSFLVLQVDVLRNGYTLCKSCGFFLGLGAKLYDFGFFG